MSPSSTRAFAARLSEDDVFRALVVENPQAALDEYGLFDDPALIPDVVELPSKDRLAALELSMDTDEPPKPKPEPKPKPQPQPIHVQLFDPD